MSVWALNTAISALTRDIDERTAQRWEWCGHRPRKLAPSRSWKEHRTDDPLEPLEGAWPGCYLDAVRLVSRTGRG